MTTTTLHAPITMEGRRVRLEPLKLEHHAELCQIGLDPELWKWTISHAHTSDELRAYIEDAIAHQMKGTAIPFLIRELATGRAVGSTRYGNIDLAHRRVEIGWTWIGKEWQRTAINTETKLLLLTYAFERLGCTRVELKTDALNIRSRDAITRIGAVEEGTLRKHSVTSRGRTRDTVYFSIVNDEWPSVKASLLERLA